VPDELADFERRLLVDELADFEQTLSVGNFLISSKIKSPKRGIFHNTMFAARVSDAL
jgi:hypothetical protein